MYKKNVAHRIEHINIDTRRACAVKLTMNDNFKILLITLYVPCDTQSVTQDNEEYERVINRIETLTDLRL